MYHFCSLYQESTYNVFRKFVNSLQFSLFLHKYDIKRNSIFMQVLKLVKRNPNKQIRLKKSQFFLTKEKDLYKCAMGTEEISEAR